jgi:hypothetical protein
MKWEIGKEKLTLIQQKFTCLKYMNEMCWQNANGENVGLIDVLLIIDSSNCMQRKGRDTCISLTCF